jgi:hypothetical protein
MPDHAVGSANARQETSGLKERDMKIQDDYRYAKGWANSHVLAAVIIAAIVGFAIGLIV